MITLKIFK